MMIRSTLVAAGLGILAAPPALYLLAALSRHDQSAIRASAESGLAAAATPAEVWPICSSMGSIEDTADSAPLDPDFVAGKKALASGDWPGAIDALTRVGLRDARNADIQHYLGYAYRRLRQLDPAVQHYQKALLLNSRHRGAHKHLGEAYLLFGNRAKAEEHLAALDQICLIPCDEYDELKQAIAEYNKLVSH